MPARTGESPARGEDGETERGATIELPADGRSSVTLETALTLEHSVPDTSILECEGDPVGGEAVRFETLDDDMTLPDRHLPTP